ncbi:MAG: helix-turn-helix transcriptional regulator [Ruminococcus sp.]|nr:helix-turn-helix transcriptional regulator [Ruminococcus sp.]
MVWNFSRTEPIVYRNSDLMPDYLREKSPIYQQWMQPLRVYHGMGCTIVKQHFYGSITMFRTKEMGDFTQEELYLLEVLNTHLASHMQKLYPNGVRESDFQEIDMDKHWLGKYHLTVREQEIVRQLQYGLTNQEIGTKLCISEVTVKKHMSHIFEKMQVKNRNQLFLKLQK